MLNFMLCVFYHNNRDKQVLSENQHGVGAEGTVFNLIPRTEVVEGTVRMHIPPGRLVI